MCSAGLNCSFRAQLVESMAHGSPFCLSDVFRDETTTNGMSFHGLKCEGCENCKEGCFMLVLLLFMDPWIGNFVIYSCGN